MVSTQTGSVLERTVLKEGPLFFVADRGGDIKALNLEGHGLYYRDRRHLSLFEMNITGTRMTLLSSAGELNFMSQLQFATDVLLGQDGSVLAQPRTISIDRHRFVSGSLHERVDLRNYNAHPVPLTVRFTCGSDFRDMFDVRGFEVEDHGAAGTVAPISVQPDGVVFGYHGRAGMRRQTLVKFDPSPKHIEIVNQHLKQVSRAEGTHIDQRDEGLTVPPMAAIVFQVELPAMSCRSINVSVTPVADHQAAQPTPTWSLSEPERSRAVDAACDAIRDRYQAWGSAATRIETDHEVFDQILRRAEMDLLLLLEDFDGDLVPTAGIPWFAVPFGRDSLMTAMQTLSLRPSIAAGTLRFLARHQGRGINPVRGEEPGKILHEIRPGERGHISDSIYYGSIDSTPLFLVALGEYLNWTGDLALARELLPNAEAALAWIRDFGDADGDGFVECDRYPKTGLGTQGWKDSPDAVSHSDGRLAGAPIALAEVQAYVFAAHRSMAQLYGCLGDLDKERAQRGAAERMRSLFLEQLAMIDDQGPFWAMGLDVHKNRIETVTSNPGHALWAGLLRGESATVAVERLIAEDMLSGWGIRTLSARSPAFNPMSYHNGSVWPHDTALIALGMKRAGADGASRAVASEIFEAAMAFPGWRLPELWCGFTRDRNHNSVPGQYPVGCSPQAWAAGSAFMLLQALLGLEPNALAGACALKPALPAWLGRVSFRNLRVGDTQIDFDVVRDGHRVIVDVMDDGGLRIEAREAGELLSA